MVSFTEQNVLFDVVPFDYFCFDALAQGDTAKKILRELTSETLVLMFSLRNFMVSGLTLSLYSTLSLFLYTV